MTPAERPAAARRPLERGLTLTELTVVMVLATLVMVGLVGFYLNSQGVWMDASAQAITQREVSALIESMAGRVRGAAHAEVHSIPDALHQQLILRDNALAETARFQWSSSDSRVHEIDPVQGDKGAIGNSPVTRFELSTNDTLVRIVTLEVASSQGDTIRVTTTLALYNHE